jgi:uncharacterized phage infection (PIP) family protein YhgE
MSSLQETLPALSSSLPELPGKLEQLVTDAKEVDQAAADILVSVGRKRGELAEHLTHLQQALHEVTAEAHENDAQVKAGGDAIEAASDQLVSGLATQADAVEAHAKETETAMGTLDHALVEAGQEAHDGGQQIAHGTERLGQVLGEGQKNVSEAVEMLANEMRELDSAFDEAKTAITEGTDTLVNTLQQFVHQTRARADQTAHAFEAVCNALTHVVQDEEKRAVDFAKQATEEVRNTLEKELKQQATDAATQIEAALANLGHTLGQAETDTRAQKDALEQRVNELRQTSEPLPAAVAKVHEAVQNAGLSWS